MTSVSRFLWRAFFVALCVALSGIAALAHAPVYEIEVSGEPPAICAGETSKITATVTADGVPVEGHSIQFTVLTPDTGQVSPTTAETDGNGCASTDFTPNGTLGDVTIRACDQSHGSLCNTCQVAVVGSCRYRVKWDSPGPVFDGHSWATAYHSVQQAINAASSGDEVWVARGTYEENIVLESGVGVYGAFAGNETSRATHRPWIANKTVIQGDGNDTVVLAESGVGRDTVIDGFTITGGYYGHYVPSIADNLGGGICCDNASPTISHNTVVANGDRWDMYVGGGVGCYGGSPLLTENTISGNSARWGGGIGCRESSPVVSNNVITGNRDAEIGGGVYCGDSTSVVLTNNTIAHNDATSYGGGIYWYNSTGRLSNNAVIHNAITSWGNGALYCTNFESQASPEVSNNTFAYNSSYPAGGACVVMNIPSPTVVNNIILDSFVGLYWGGSGTPVVHSNCISAPTPYQGWSTNPTQDLLANPFLVGMHIQPGSPCIGEGDNSLVQAGDLDIDGQARKQPTTAPNAIVDIGADEWSETDSGIGVPISSDELDFFSSIVNYCGN